MSNKAGKFNERVITDTMTLTTVPHWIFPMLESIGRSVRFSPSVVMDETTLRFVPSSQLTVMVECGLIESLDGIVPVEKSDGWKRLPIVAQRQTRTGSLTGQMRDVLILRRLPTHGTLPGKKSTGELTHAVIDTFLDVYFGAERINRYSLFRSTSVDPVGVMLSQRTAYFAHLDRDEVRGLAEIFKARVESQKMTLVGAYRLAGQMLYAYSRGKGWVKLDNRQRAKYQTSLHWVMHTDVDVMRQAYSPTGTGQATREAARGVLGTQLDAQEGD